MDSTRDSEKQLKLDRILGHCYSRTRHMVRRCPKSILEKILECVICGVENSPLMFGSCIRRGHAICQPCYVAYVAEMDSNQDLVVCPVPKSNGDICGQKFTPLDYTTGVPPYLDFFLRNCKFSCASSIYGCEFEGCGADFIKHEASMCTFSTFRRCQFPISVKDICTAQFHSAIESSNHYADIHGIPHGAYPSTRTDVTLSDANDKVGPLENEAVNPEKGKRIFAKLWSYAPGEYCVLVIEEFQHWLRIWATEADPLVDEKKVTIIKITVPPADLAATHYQFTGKVLPFNTYSFKEEDPIGFFDVPKNFLKQFMDDKRQQISVEFEIGEQSADVMKKGEASEWRKNSTGASEDSVAQQTQLEGKVPNLPPDESPLHYNVAWKMMCRSDNNIGCPNNTIMRV